MTMYVCPECGKRSLMWSHEGLICKHCGSVLAQTYVSGTPLVA